MPVTKIEVKRQWPHDTKQRIIDATHAAMIAALKIPEHDKLIRYIEHTPLHFQSPPGTSDNYTLIEISLFPGRSLDAKRNLYKNIVQSLGEIGIAAADIRIILYEVPMDNWGIRGGFPASDLELGFKLDV